MSVLNLYGLELQRTQRLLAMFVMTCLLLVHVMSFVPYLCDDALISLRYVDRFVHGYGLTWTAGVPVEGYSNLLWVLLLSIPGFLGLNLVVSAQVLGVCLTVLTGLILFNAAFEQGGLRLGWVVGLLYVSCGPFAVWAIGGLEQPLLVLLLVWGLLKVAHLIEHENIDQTALYEASVPFALLCWVRPDAPFFVGVIGCFFWYLWRKKSWAMQWRLLLAWWLIPLLFISIQLGFRLWFYHAWLPNTGVVKLGLSMQRIDAGLLYLASTNLLSFPVLMCYVLSLYHMWRNKSACKLALLSSFLVGLWAVYLVIIGGELFPAGRIWLPALAIMLMTCIFGLGHRVVGEMGASPKRQCAWIEVFLAILLIGTSLCLVSPLLSKRVANIDWVWKQKPLSALLMTAFSYKPPLLAVTAAGGVPFWTQYESLDLLGLNDHYIARVKSGRHGPTFISGHEAMDLDYVFSKNPDVILFGDGDLYYNINFSIRVWQDQRLFDHYVLVGLSVPAQPLYFGHSTPTYQAFVWFRRANEAVVEQQPHLITIPGYMMIEKYLPAQYFKDETVGVKAPPIINIPDVSWLVHKKLAWVSQGNVMLQGQITKLIPPKQVVYTWLPKASHQQWRVVIEPKNSQLFLRQRWIKKGGKSILSLTNISDHPVALQRVKLLKG